MESETVAPASQLTPLMRQYWDIKSAHEDKILLFRMGDFYEMFFRDAEIAAPVVGIALTSRNKKSADETPMCGVPHHSIAGPINKLLQAGFKIAICDQVEDPKFAKGIVKRAVTRILSPGVVYDPDTLDALKTNYLASFDAKSASFLDTTTGEAFYYLLQGAEQKRILQNLSPVEIVLSSEQSYQEQTSTITVHDVDAFKTDLPPSAERLLAYAQYMQGELLLKTLKPFELRELNDRLEISPTVIRHLEIFETYKGEASGSLFHAIHRCKTSSGARLLKNWLQFPLRDVARIEKRQKAVTHWSQEQDRLKEVRQRFSRMGDVERRLGKLGNPGCTPRDLLALSETLSSGLEVSALSPERNWRLEFLNTAQELIQKVTTTLVDEPPVQIKNGGLIRRGVSAALDELIDLSTDSSRLLLELEAREKELTGISSLKVRFNNVFGYYIEITNTHKDKVPQRYQRKQTLANAERYLTPELEKLEGQVLTAQAKRLELEVEIFEDLKTSARRASSVLLQLAREWSELDVLTSLAFLALEQNYVRPSFSETGHLGLKASRHPVVEQALKMPFVANDIEIHARHCLLLTGPNMAGKSTLMRQVAVTCILAQIGSFVPAAAAEVPVLDKIFTRIGASDFLSEGLSTFMVEMQETAEMLKAATPRSLVILDEVGRGTSTFDGMSLAQAILEYLLQSSECLTLFATHYHELTQMRFSQLHNAHMAIREKNGEIFFLHSLVPGAANKSYGIQVAKLAGMPNAVTKRAQTILKNLEELKPSPQLSLLDAPAEDNLGGPFPEVLESIKALDLNRLTPLEALMQIAQWQQKLS